MWTKQDILQESFGELALQGYVFNVGPDEMASALRKMDMYMATMQPKKLFTSYNFPANPSDGSQLDDASGLPDSDIEAAVLQVAIRLCGSFGKQPPSPTLGAAKLALDTIMIKAAQPYQQEYPSTLPRGAGNKPWRWSQYATFFNPCNTDDCSVSVSTNQLMQENGYALLQEPDAYGNKYLILRS